MKKKKMERKHMNLITFISGCWHNFFLYNLIHFESFLKWAGITFIISNLNFFFFFLTNSSVFHSEVQQYYIFNHG